MTKSNGNRLKQEIKRQIAITAAIVFLLSMTAHPAMAQLVVSAKAGLVQYVEGEVFLADEPARLPKIAPGNYLQMENGQSLRTAQGRAELLLTPDAYLRLGENSLLKLEQNMPTNTQLALERGSALIEVLQVIKGNRLVLRSSVTVIDIKKEGLYRLDSDSGEFLVYGGEAQVTNENGKNTIKARKMVRLEGNLASVKYDAIIDDPLHMWSAKRSFNLFIAGWDAGKPMIWMPTSQGWLHNSRYGMKFHSQVFFDRWVKYRREQQRAAAMAAAIAAKKAAESIPRTTAATTTSPAPQSSQQPTQQPAQ